MAEEDIHPREAAQAKPAKKGCGCAPLMVAGLILFLAAGLAVPQLGGVQDRARHLQASINCR